MHRQIFHLSFGTSAVVCEYSRIICFHVVWPFEWLHLRLGDNSVEQTRIPRLVQQLVFKDIHSTRWFFSPGTPKTSCTSFVSKWESPSAAIHPKSNVTGSRWTTLAHLFFSPCTESFLAAVSPDWTFRRINGSSGQHGLPSRSSSQCVDSKQQRRRNGDEHSAGGIT